MRFVTPVLRLPLSSSKFPTQSHFKMLNIFRWCLKLGARVCSGASSRFRELTGQISTSSEGKRWLFPPRLPEDVEWERLCVCVSVCRCYSGCAGLCEHLYVHTNTHTHTSVGRARCLLMCTRVCQTSGLTSVFEHLHSTHRSNQQLPNKSLGVSLWK